MKETRWPKIVFIARRVQPIIKNTVLFQSFGGQYNDNPKYISMALHEACPFVNIVWAISNKSVQEDIPECVHRVEYGSSAHIRYLCKSQVVVDNMTGVRETVRRKYSSFLKKLITSSRQLNISTWHGTPIKKIGLDIKEMANRKYYITSSDSLVAGCVYTKERLEQAFYPIPIKLVGTPRNDVLVNGVSEEEKQRIKQKLGLPLEKKIVLFAPTFRDTVDYSGVKQMQELDIAGIVNRLKKKLGGEWIFVFRVHHEVLKKIDVDAVTATYPGIVLDGNQHDDMAEYLSVTDALITDYSGSVFDFALTGKPGFLYTPDKEHYIKDERGVYISLDELPYPHAVTAEALYELIEQYDPEASQKRIADFNEKVGNSEFGNAAEKVALCISKYLETNNKALALQELQF